MTMRIGIHTRYMEHARIDGTAVYVHNIVRRLPALFADAHLRHYHTDAYHPELPMSAADNVADVCLPRVPLWTQTAFTAALWRDKCDVAWLPMHTLPYIRRRAMRTVVTIHDLAFKIYPETFPARDVFFLNLLTDYAAMHADVLIAVSEATKRDIMRFYPSVRSERIHVVHHGFDPSLWHKSQTDDAQRSVRDAYGVQDVPYIIHVGAVQPRKNLTLAVDALPMIREVMPDAHLVLVGGDGWKAEGIHAHIAQSPVRDAIRVTGNIPFDDVVALVRGARAGVMPSLYEGFGIFGLECFAAGVPLVAARTSCLPEVYGAAAMYFDPHDARACAVALVRVCTDAALRDTLVRKGAARAQMFTWDKSAAATARILRSAARLHLSQKNGLMTV